MSLVLLTATGCTLLGAASYKLSGPPKIPAQYVMRKVPTLVLVENFRNPDAVRLDAERLSRHVTVELGHYELATMIDPGILDELRMRPGFAKMSQGQIGQAAGAEQVVYLDLLRFNVEEALGSEMIRGQVELTIRVVDVATGDTLWPTDAPAGKLMQIETPYLRTGQGTGRSGGGPGASEIGLRETMCRTMAVTIGRMFRKWTPEFEGKADE